MRKHITILVTAIIIAGSHYRAQSQEVNTLSKEKDNTNLQKTPPVVDHHLHLYSPAAVDLSSPPLLPEIELPEELAQFVRKRTERWNDQNALTELYTENALYSKGGTHGWVQGQKEVAGYVKWTISDTPYYIKPVFYDLDEWSARIAGYFVEADETDRHFGFFLFSLVKSSDGVWQSAAENYRWQGAPTFDTAYLAEHLISKLDKAGIERGVVMSNAYYFDAVRPEPVIDAYQKVSDENDWTAQQVAQYPERLMGFCSFNPLKNYAIKELNRCAATGKFKGIKMNFNAAQVDFKNPEHVEKVRGVMEVANNKKLPMIIHVRSSPTYGAYDAKVFLRELVAAAPDVPIQIAHLWGGENFSSSALAVYADAIAAKDPITKNLYFDISGSWAYGQPEEMKEIVRQIRKIGLQRIVYGSDGEPAESWEAFLKKVPLTSSEFQIIAENIAPYVE